MKVNLIIEFFANKGVHEIIGYKFGICYLGATDSEKIFDLGLSLFKVDFFRKFDRKSRII